MNETPGNDFRCAVDCHLDQGRAISGQRVRKDPRQGLGRIHAMAGDAKGFRQRHEIRIGQFRADHTSPEPRILVPQYIAIGSVVEDDDHHAETILRGRCKFLNAEQKTAVAGD